MRYLLLALYWLGYFFIHSLLASEEVKARVARRYPSFMPRYRLAFNFVAILLILPAPFLMHFGPPLWQWRGGWEIFALFAKALAVGGFLYSLSCYDMREFFGLKAGEAGFFVSPFHRFVRHPWYFLALVILWTSDLNAGEFLSYSLVSLYLFVGSLLEERKLVRHFGSRYLEYRKRVPGFFPLPWKWLTKEEARHLSDWKK